jgi:hypothetical protein
VDSGRAFDFLSWYRPLTISIATGIKPDLAALRGALLWKLDHPGTCSAVHLKRLEFEKLGRFALDRERVRVAFPDMRPGTYAAINDISIGNQLHVAPALSERPMPKSGNFMHQTIRGIGEILAS